MFNRVEDALQANHPNTDTFGHCETELRLVGCTRCNLGLQHQTQFLSRLRPCLCLCWYLPKVAEQLEQEKEMKGALLHFGPFPFKS